MRATDRHPPIGNLLYSLGPRFCDRDQARRAPAGLVPSGDDQGQGQDGRPPFGVRRHSLRPRRAVRASRRRGARKPVPLPSTPPYRLPASHPAARGDAPCGRSSRKPALRAYGFHRYAAEPPFFSLPRAVPRLLLGACDGGSEGDRQVRESHRFPLPIWNRPSSGREIFAGRATARLFDAPAHQRGSEFRQENNAIDRI